MRESYLLAGPLRLSYLGSQAARQQTCHFWVDSLPEMGAYSG